jgi:hypothetical protein
LVSPSGNETALMNAVALAPVVVYFAVDPTFVRYSRGVFAPTPVCNNATLNHAMLLVGYSTRDQSWRVKNQWSVRWGEAGYARVAMTHDARGPCGMYMYAFAYRREGRKERMLADEGQHDVDAPTLVSDYTFDVQP